jgi:nitrite reductase/ring-hydroxylating ferredoxin subunit
MQYIWIKHKYSDCKSKRRRASNQQIKRARGGKMVFEKVAEPQDIPTGQMKAVKFGEQEVLVANVNGTYFAIGNVCTHEGGNLSKGTLQGNIVTCPKHKAQFDVTTGKVVFGPKVLFMHPKIKDANTFAVKVEGAAILLEHK